MKMKLLRGRLLAAPFVVTAGLACVAQSPTPGGPGGEGTDPEGNVRKTGVAINPPPPAQPAKSSDENQIPPGTKVVANPPPPSEGVWSDSGGGNAMFNYADGRGTVYKNAKGECVFTGKIPACPPNAACNPPPPKPIQCPADAP